MTTNEMTTRELLSIVEAADALPMIEIRDCLIAAEKHDAVEALNNLCDQLFPFDMLKALESHSGWDELSDAVRTYDAALAAREAGE